MNSGHIFRQNLKGFHIYQNPADPCRTASESGRGNRVESRFVLSYFSQLFGRSRVISKVSRPCRTPSKNGHRSPFKVPRDFLGEKFSEKSRHFRFLLFLKCLKFFAGVPFVSDILKNPRGNFLEPGGRGVLKRKSKLSPHVGGFVMSRRQHSWGRVCHPSFL